jgi:guanine nucleotide-binding protein subunit beta-2-like 1 protein
MAEGFENIRGFWPALQKMVDADQAVSVDSSLWHRSQFRLRAILKGHYCLITSLQVNNEHQYLVSGSRDRTALVWKLTRQQKAWAVRDIRLVGHNHFISGVCFSSDSTHLLTSSWDKTIRLWDVQKRSTKKLFCDHKKDVLAVTFSPCNRRIITCSRDKTVKL